MAALLAVIRTLLVALTCGATAAVNATPDGHLITILVIGASIILVRRVLSH